VRIARGFALNILGNNSGNELFKKPRNYPKCLQMVSERRGRLILLYQKVVKSFEADKSYKNPILSLLVCQFRHSGGVETNLRESYHFHL